jgi:hypothetical protein
MQTGTLKELDVKPGDVVECVYGGPNAESGRKYTINDYGDIKYYATGDTNVSHFRLISRASEAPKTWAEMTPEEKGALLLAHHEGKVIEVYGGNGWWSPCNLWADEDAYRIRPEPVREVVKLAVWRNEGHFYEDVGTIEIVDGIPDCDSINMERI